METRIRIIAMLLAIVVFAPFAAASSTTIPIDVQATYLITNQDPNAKPATPISLSALGIKEGDKIQLQSVGTLSFCITSGCPQIQTSLRGLFSATGDPSTAIATVDGTHFPAPPTLFGNIPTDVGFVLSDFFIFAAPDATTVTVPKGANFLFVIVPDSFYSDNSGAISVILTPVTCSALVDRAIKGPFGNGGTAISASFTPNLGFSLTDAASVCGFSLFDWQQRVNVWPRPTPLFQNGTPPNPLSAPPSFFDPVLGGYTYQLPFVDRSFPFYYDPKPGGDLADKIVENTLGFFDRPADSCLFGGKGLNPGCPGKKRAQRGARMVFTTHLVGVNKDGTATDLGIGFTWASAFNGTSGGVATTKNDQAEDPGSGTGGITILEVQETSNPPAAISVQPLPAGDSCDGSFAGQFFGDINVVDGQKCVFTDGAIFGSVHQNGGELVLKGVVVAGNVEINAAGRLTVGPFSEIDGNLEIRNVTPSQVQNSICSTIVEGNIELVQNEAMFQIGSTPAPDCDGNVIGGHLQIDTNLVPISVVGNTINGDVEIGNNMGSVSLLKNDIAKQLICSGNALISGANNLAAKKNDQCTTF